MPSPSRLSAHSTGARVLRPEWRQGLIGFVIVSAVVPVFFGLIALVEGNSDGAALCFGGATAVVTVAIPVFLRPNYDVLEPLTALILMVIVGVGLTSPYIVFTETAHVEQFMLLGRGRSFLMRPMALIVMGLLGASIGYMFPRRHGGRASVARMLSIDWSGGRVAFIVLVLGAVSIVSIITFVILLSIDVTAAEEISRKRFYQIEGAETEGSLGYLRWGARLAQTALFIYLLYRVRTGDSVWHIRSLVVAVPLLVLTLAIPFLTNSRAPMVMDVAGLVAVLYYSGVRVSTRTLVLGLVAAVAVFQLMTAFRQQEEVRDLATLEELGTSVLGSRHFIDITRTAVVVEAIPDDLEYRYGTTFFAWMLAPVPRSVWPGKPPVGVGKEVARKAFGHNDRRGVPPGLFGEAVLNFGALGILPVFFLAGVLMRWAYEAIRPYLRHDAAILIYGSTVHISVFYLFNNEVSVFVVRTLIAAIPIVLTLSFLRMTAPRRVTRARRRRRPVAYA